jgi:hypothetical protein
LVTRAYAVEDADRFVHGSQGPFIRSIICYESCIHGLSTTVRGDYTGHLSPQSLKLELNPQLLDEELAFSLAICGMEGAIARPKT